MLDRWIVENRFIVFQGEKRKGGMATVYKATDLDNGSFVAIKLFDNQDNSKEITTAAFERDSQSLEELSSHENVAKYLSYGRDERTGCYYIALEWMEKSLKDILCGEEIPWDYFYVNYGKKILSALKFAHKRNIIHRDIKPANVMFSSGNELRIVDFGISKYKKYWGGGVTFSLWKSVPYSPPETGNFGLMETIDIYSFCALSLACLLGRDLQEEDELLKLVNEVDLHQGVKEIFIDCLSVNPDERYKNVEELEFALDSFTFKSESVGNGDAVCYIKLTDNAIRKLQVSLGLPDKSSIQKYVLDEMNEACAFDRRKGGGWVFLSVSHEYVAKADVASKSHFLIVAVHQREAWFLENIRQRKYQPKVKYVINNFPSGEDAQNKMELFLAGFYSFEEESFENINETEKNKVVNTWRSLLKLQLDLERLSRMEVEYSGVQLSNGNVEFLVGDGDWGGLIGEERVIFCDGKSQVRLVVESVSLNKLLVSEENIDIEMVPKKGVISLDTRRQSVSRRRQEEALDDFLSERSCRADLKNKIFNPDSIRDISLKNIETYYQNDLDKSKKEIVESVVGLKDFLVVNGPPGTGKTKVIAETVLQYLKEYPKAKILISSQTHNALDNAIEKIRNVKKEDQFVKIVRVGKESDPRISPQVKDLLLENMVDKWLDEVKEKSSLFLDEWCQKEGVNKQEVEQGLSVSLLRQRLERFNNLVSEKVSIEDETKRVKELIRGYKAEKVIPDSLGEAELERERLENDFSEIEIEIIRARRDLKAGQKDMVNKYPDGEAFIDMSLSELKEWEEEYLVGSESREKCKNIIEFLQDWVDRFGRSTDFYAAYLEDANVVAATCNIIGARDFKNVNFDLCIVDEASKATPVETLLPMVKSKRWVLVGDPAQLPPFVQIDSSNRYLLSKHELSEHEIKRTLLDFLIEKLPNKYVKKLDVQYRMCPEIGSLISHIFYDDELKTGRGPAKVSVSFKSARKPVVWYCTSRNKNRFESKSGKSFVNRFEVNLIKDMLLDINRVQGIKKNKASVCVLSFYSSQESNLNYEISKIRNKCDWLEIVCASVDAFQGREADICIISITRCNKAGELGFVDNKNRVNVALSRGKEALLMVGDSNFCRGAGIENPLDQVITYITKNSDSCSFVKV